MPETISSAANPLVRRIRSLADRRHRAREGAFYVEGIQPVWQAVEAGAEVETLIVAPDLLVDSPACRMVAEQEARGTRVAHLTSELFERLSDREGPAGLAAIVRARVGALDELSVTAESVFVVLHEVGNPGNLGTIVRTADAAGAAGVVLLGRTADPHAPSAVKASMGALFALPVVHEADPERFFAWAAGAGVRVVTTSVRADADLWTAEYRLPVALMLGSEARGLPEDLLDHGDPRVRIPMSGTAHSLNLAVAAGLMLYEVRRRVTNARRDSS